MKIDNIKVESGVSDPDRDIANDPIDLTIVIPCLNEADNIEGILDSVASVVVNQKFTTEVVVVDDESDDNTYELAQKWANENEGKLPIRVISRPLKRRGYGAVVRYGAAHGLGKYCIFVSADMVDPINLIPELYEEMEKGAVLAQCSRYINPGDDNTIPFKYKFFQFFFRRGVKIAIGHYIPDSTYAFKMFRRRETLGVGLSQNRFSISPEITFKSILMGGEVKYIPGAQGTRAFGVSKFIFRKEGVGYTYCLVRAFLHRMRLLYWF